MRQPLPRWKRLFLFGHAFALDHLTLLHRYRAFDADADLDQKREGYLASVLSENRIFIPLADTFNDPWEAAPSIETAPWARDRVQAVSEFLSFLIGNSDRFSAERIAAELRTLPMDAVQDRMQSKLLSRLKQTPILSFCQQPDNFLMWSYYAKGHNGYALVFDAKKLPAAAAYRVRYSRRHPVIYTSRRDMSGIGRDVLATKARQWKHEREWRLITSLEGDARLGLTNVSRVENGILANIPKDSIVGVIIGDQLYRGPFGAKVVTLLRAHRSHVQSWLAKIDRRKFRIDLRAIRFVD